MSKRPYLIAEIGINHNGDLQTALELIAHAKAIGFDCVKFQKRDPDICVPEEQKAKPRMWHGTEMTYLEYKKAIEFEKQEYDTIDAYCRTVGIKWTASVWDTDSLRFMLQYDVPFIKIPSALVDNDELIQTVNESGTPVIISDGMLTTAQFLDIANKYQNLNGVMHTNSTYPCINSELDLNVIKLYSDKFPICNVGYSGHEQGFTPTLVATAVGADIIERHITLDKNAEGTDHRASLDLNDCKEMIAGIDQVCAMLGHYHKIALYAGEEQIAEKLKR